MKNILSIFAAATCLFLASCGSSSKDCGSEGFAQEFQSELTKINEAAQEFASDPTNTSKCEAYKDAFRDYIDALEGWEDCAVELNQAAGWRQSLDEARDSLNDFEC